MKYIVSQLAWSLAFTEAMWAIITNELLEKLL